MKNKYYKYFMKIQAGLAAFVISACAVTAVNTTAAYADTLSSEADESGESDVVEESDTDRDDSVDLSAQTAAETAETEETESAALEDYAAQEGSEVFAGISVKENGTVYTLKYVSLINAWINTGSEKFDTFSGSKVTFETAEGEKITVKCSKDVQELAYVYDGTVTKLMADPVDIRDLNLASEEKQNEISVDFNSDEYLNDAHVRVVDMACIDENKNISVQKDVYLTYDGRYRLTGKLEGCISTSVIGKQKVGTVLTLENAEIDSETVPAINISNTDNTTERLGLLINTADGSVNTINGKIYAESIVSLCGDRGILKVNSDDIALEAKNDVNIEGGIYYLNGSDAAVKSKRAFFLEKGTLYLKAGDYGINARNVYINDGRLFADTSKGILSKLNTRINGGTVVALTGEFKPLDISAQGSTYIVPKKSLKNKTIILKNGNSGTIAAIDVESKPEGIFVSAPSCSDITAVEAEDVSGAWIGNFCSTVRSYSELDEITTDDRVTYESLLEKYMK